MPRGELARDFFNNVLDWMVCKMTRLEHLIFPKLPLRWMKRLFWTVVPTRGHPWLTLLRRLIRHIALEHLSDYGF